MRPLAGTPMRRLTVLLSASDRAGHHSLATDLLARARHAGLSGATLRRGRAGRGHSGLLHHAQLFAEDAPLALVVVDRPEAIDAFVALLAEAGEEVVLLVDDVTALRA